MNGGQFIFELFLHNMIFFKNLVLFHRLTEQLYECIIAIAISNSKVVSNGYKL